MIKNLFSIFARAVCVIIFYFNASFASPLLCNDQTVIPDNLLTSLNVADKNNKLIDYQNQIFRYIKENFKSENLGFLLTSNQPGMVREFGLLKRESVFLTDEVMFLPIGEGVEGKWYYAIVSDTSLTESSPKKTLLMWSIQKGRFVARLNLPFNKGQLSGAQDVQYLNPTTSSSITVGNNYVKTSKLIVTKGDEAKLHEFELHQNGLAAGLSGELFVSTFSVSEIFNFRRLK